MTDSKRSFLTMSDNSVGSEKRILFSLGLCVRAGKVIFGTPMICDAMRRGGKNKPVAVFEASDTSDNTHKKLSDKCSFYKVPLHRLTFDGAALASALGKTASLAAIAVTDERMCAMAMKSITEDTQV